MTRDYRDTVFLPQTAFPMKAGLSEKEPEILKRWDKINLYRLIEKAGEGREKFVLHDGPPFANGHIHLGTALNKILKDIINRAQWKLGKATPYVPGWDCHGLPIEAKIEEKYKKKGLDKDHVPIQQFRQECRSFAEEWIQIQKEEFKRLGGLGDFEKPYSTMEAVSEAEIIRLIHLFLETNKLYRGVRPVLWSIAEKTALAEAEVEYKDHESLSIYVRFPVVKTSIKALEKASAIIWTTTPWTLPGNRAVAYQEDIDYVALKVVKVNESSLAQPGEVLLLAAELAQYVMDQVGVLQSTQLAQFKGRDLKGTVCEHPLCGQGYDFDVPLLPGEHVTVDTGTGLVHTAPGHGREDFALGQQFNLEIPQTVDEAGLYYSHVPLFAGQHIFKVNPLIVRHLEETGTLLFQHKLVHSYPHSWRSKTPLIYRTTPQWFIDLEKNALRQTALNALEKVTWYPPQSVNRIRSMVESRPDWCISRQRTWGVPLAFFIHKKTGEPLKDPAVLSRIVEAVKEGSSDVWYLDDYARFLLPEYSPDEYEQVKDIVDVWFESGSTQVFVLKGRPELKWPADLYLEGSDQHRGWFQSSLLLGCAIEGKAPFKQVFTHGFVVDENGRKMSKSLGNTVDPNQVIRELGADILRLWVANSDYHEDLRFGPEIIKHQQDIYRRYRNTLRYLLGALEGFKDGHSINYTDLPEFEKWVLHRIFEIDQKFRSAFKSYDLQNLYHEIHNFCAIDLSAFYFDIRKDSLYCDLPRSDKRQATLSVLSFLFDCLVKWLSPVLCFTTEEAWLCRYPSEDGSIHIESLTNIPSEWKNDQLAEKYSHLRQLRGVLTGALELARANKVIGSSLQAHLHIYLNPQWQKFILDIDLAEFAIVSTISLHSEGVPQGAFRLDEVEGVATLVESAKGQKCARCWKVLEEVGKMSHSDICARCNEAVNAYDTNHE